VGKLKLAAAENKQALAHYSWQQQQTIAIKRHRAVSGEHVGPK